MASDDLRVRPGKLRLASILGIPSHPVKLYEKLETPVVVDTPVNVINPFRIIGGFDSHKFLLVFEIPPSSVFELFHRSPASDGKDDTSPRVYDFGNHLGVDCEFPMKFVIYRLGNSPALHLRSVLNCEAGAADLVPILRDIKGSSLSVAVVDDNGNLLQAEKLACCQRGSKGGICFRIKDFISLDALTTSGRSLLTKTGSLLIRIQFIGYSLAPQSQPETAPSSDGIAQYTLDSKFRNLLYQIVRDEEYNSFLRSWASNTKFANVKLRIQDKSKNVTILPAHRVLLAAQSNSLGGYLRPREEIVLEGFHHFTLLVLIDYLYSGEIHCNDLSTLVNLAEVGNRLEVYGLKDKCVRDIIMMFNNPVTNVKHLVACYKLGEMLKSACLKDKAVECFRIMKHTNKCIDFPFANALMAITSPTTDAEFNRILNSLYDKTCPVTDDTVLNLVQFPADEVKLIGTTSENWTGYLYVIPTDYCKSMAEVCLSDPKSGRNEAFSLLQNLEIEKGFFELVKKSSNCISLRVTSNSDLSENSRRENRELDRNSESLGISRSDYLSVIAESIGMTLKVSLLDAQGRIITANMTRGVLLDGNHYFWEVNSFITPSVMASWDGVSEMLVRISFGAVQLHPTFRVMKPTDHRYQHYRKYDMTFLKTVNTEPFTLRLLTQLQQGADSDAVVNVIDGRKTKIFRAPVHAVILSAMSSHFEKVFGMSSKLEIDIGNYSVEAIQMLLNFIYGEDICPGHIGLVLELISAAEELEIRGLRDKCIERLCSCQLNLETCIHLYEIGCGTNSIPLMDIAVKFFRRNRAAVDMFQEFKDLLRRHPKILDVLNIS